MGHIVWISGLSGSGKTTLINEVYQIFNRKGLKVICLDGDILRQGINSGLGFSIKDRKENCRRAAEIAKLFAGEGYIVLAAFITPTNDLRDMVRDIIGASSSHFTEVFLSTPISVCQERDVKGLYEKAKKERNIVMSGLGAKFEVPNRKLDLQIDTNEFCIKECVSRIVEILNEKGVVETEKEDNLKKRRIFSLLKAISWRLLGAFFTIFLAWLVTEKWDFAVQIGILEFVSKIGFFYIHDRVWENFSSLLTGRFFNPDM